MKFAITQEVFKKALDAGALAATSDTAQIDEDAIALLVRSVKISAGESLVIQSGHNLLATRYVLPNSKESGVAISDKGSVLVPAKELLKWVSAQGKNSKIIVEFVKADKPTTIDIHSDKEGEEVAKFSIKKTGTIKLVSQDTSNTVGKWELDCYDPKQGIQLSFDDQAKGDHIFDIQAKKLTHALSKVSCASLDNDYNHIKDSVSIQNYKGEIYFAATDTKRCALYKGVNVDNVDSEKSTLLSVKMLLLASKVLAEEDRTSINYNEEDCKVYLSQKNIDVRITCPEKDVVQKFSDISQLIEKEYVAAGDIDKSQLMKMLISASLVNKRSVLFSFDKKSKSITLKAISENGSYKPNVSKAEMNNLEQDAKVVWSAEHLMDFLKSVKSGNVSFMFPDNMKSVKIIPEDDTDFTYYLMSVINHKYSNV